MLARGDVPSPLKNVQKRDLVLWWITANRQVTATQTRRLRTIVATTGAIAIEEILVRVHWFVVPIWMPSAAPRGTTSDVPNTASQRKPNIPTTRRSLWYTARTRRKKRKAVGVMAKVNDEVTTLSRMSQFFTGETIRNL
jgi:hypothetical protein